MRITFPNQNTIKEHLKTKDPLQLEDNTISNSVYQLAANTLANVSIDSEEVNPQLIEVIFDSPQDPYCPFEKIIELGECLILLTS